jgi:CRP/FNR family cyclic AMP-dependent transcriptional regulator
MYYINTIVGNRSINKIVVASILDESLTEYDTYTNNSFDRLLEMGLKDDEALVLLASHKSLIKYGYRLSTDSLTYIHQLFHGDSRFSSLKELIRSPFVFAKAGWIYEHAPSFLLYSTYEKEDLDSCLLNFAQGYQTHFLTNKTPLDRIERISNPRRVLATTFWEKGVWDPVELIAWTARNNLEGLQLNVDFHPFNYAKLLPEEFSEEKRQETRVAVERLGVRLNIHSPVVGPYSPYPNREKGRALFYNPLTCLELHRETIFLARDIGAESVVIHLIDLSGVREMANLVMAAAGTDVRVTIENYCETGERQDAPTFLSVLDEILELLPKEVARKNFGVTMDVGHLNIEGQDPLIDAARIGKWCKKKGVFLRMHATDNYGKLLFSPPYYSADVHGSVSGKGVNNSLIITLLRYMGLRFTVLAEQIQPLTPDDIALIDQAQRIPVTKSYKAIRERGKKRLSALKVDGLIDSKTKKEEAYQFLAGLEGLDSLREYLLYRKIQTRIYPSVDKARRSSLEYMKMPKDFRAELMEYIDDLLAPIQIESGLIDRSKVDLIYQNLSGGLFGRINQQNLNQIFYRTETCNKGDIVFEQNSLGTEMYYIKEGEVAAIIDGITLAMLGAGEIFGEMSLFYNIKRTATIRVSRDNTVLGVLPRDEFEDILLHNKKYAHELIYRLFNILPQRLRNLNEKYKAAISTLRYLSESEHESARRVEKLLTESQFLKASLAKLSSEDIRDLFSETRSFRPDEEVFAEGDKGDGVYFILQGKVRVITFSNDLREIVLGDLGKGHIFGEMALIDDKPRSASVVTTMDCKLAFMSRVQFDHLMQTKSDLAYAFMSSVCLSIFRHIVRLNGWYLKVKKEFQKGVPPREFHGD